MASASETLRFAGRLDLSELFSFPGFESTLLDTIPLDLRPLIRHYRKDRKFSLDRPFIFLTWKIYSSRDSQRNLLQTTHFWIIWWT